MLKSFDDYPMSWRPSLEGHAGPAYRALADLLEADIGSGVLRPGTRLPPQRELADFLGINVSTVSRAFKLCSKKGLLCGAVGNGTYVASDAVADPVMLREHDGSAIDLSAIVPSVACNEPVRAAAERLLKAPDAAKLFDYGVPDGTLRQRVAGVTWFERCGLKTSPDQVLLSLAGQNALAAVMGALFEPGDRVGVDELTYPGFKIAAKLFGIQLVVVRGDGCQMSAEGIRYAVANEGIKGIYVVPDFHNPTGRTLSYEARATIAHAATSENIWVIEDLINTLLDPAPLVPLAQLAPEATIAIGSLSKTVAPGVRCAFVHAPQSVRAALSSSLYALNVAPPPLLAALATTLVEEGTAWEVIEMRQRQLAERNRMVDELLAPWVMVARPTSPLRYVRLPGHFTGRGFEICAEQAGVLVCGSERFAVGSVMPDPAVRLAITTPPTDDALREGLERLAHLLVL